MTYYHPPQPTSLDLKRRFVTDVAKDAILPRVAAYLSNCGYRRKDERAFVRGVGAFTQMAFSPTGWEVTATIELCPEGDRTAVEAVFHVNTTGQVATGDEQEFFYAELEGIERAVCFNEVDARRVRRLARTALWKNALVGVVLFILTPLGGGGGVYLGGEVLKSDVCTVVFGLAGGLLGMYLGWLFGTRLVFKPPISGA